MRKDLEIQVQNISDHVMSLVQNVEPHPFGHAFLWGYVTVKLKNGSSRQYRTCFGSVCAADLDACVRLANSVPGVTAAWYNLD